MVDHVTPVPEQRIRMRAVTFAMTLVLAASVASLAAAAVTESAKAEAPTPALPSAVVPMSRQLDFTSAVNGHSYRIQVAIPFSPAPAKGFPVVYVLDGDGYFGGWSFAARLRAMSQEIEPAVVVGIGYPDAEADVLVSMKRRSYDLTPTQIDEESRARFAKAGMPAGEYAGAEAFLKVIETEIKPRVAKIVSVDVGRETLFGHSLGGLFVLHTLFNHPDAFRTYLALSPSIWWDHRVVLKDEASFGRMVADGKVAPRVYIAVGGEEQTPPSGPLPPGMTREDVARLAKESAMVDSARDLAARLGALKGAAGYEVRGRVFEGESHVSVGWAALNLLLNFALPPSPAPGAAPGH
jgi:predicted alpha/beta superfamily hydrolase